MQIVAILSLYRLQRSHCILFSNRTYLWSFAELAQYNIGLITRTHCVLKG